MKKFRKTDQFLLLAAVTGLIVLFSVFNHLKKDESEHIHAQFERIMKEHCNIVKREVELTTESLYVIKILFESFPSVSRDTFRHLAQPIIKRHQGIQAIEWIPWVRKGERKRYESRAQSEGYQGFVITQRQSQKEMVPDIQRDEYFPVYYVEPLKGNEAALGYNLGSEAGRLKALNKSRETGTVTATEAVALVQETGRQKGFLIFLPIYHRDIKTAAGSGSFRGFILGVFRIEDMINSALPVISDETDADIWLYDVTASKKELLMHHASKSGAIEQQDFDYAATFQVADRSWQLLARPSAAFIGQHKDIHNYWLLGAGFFILFMILYFLADRYRKLEKVRIVNEELEQAQKIARIANWKIKWPEKMMWMSKEMLSALGINEKMLPVPFEKMIQIIHPDDQQRVKDDFEIHFRDEKYHETEFRVLLEGLGERIIKISARTESDYSGKPIWITGISQDITEERNMEKERRFSESFLQAVFDTGPDIMITTYGERIESGNARMLEFTGYESIESFTKEHGCICDFFEEVPGYIQKRMDKESWLEYIYSHPDGLHKAIMKKEGISHIFKISAEKLMFNDKKRSIVVLSDITELEAKNKALLQSKIKFQSLVEEINDWIWEVDAEGIFTYASPRVKDILGYEPEEIVGKSIFDLMQAKEAQRVGEFFFETAKSETPFEHFENIHMHKNGDPITIETGGRPVFDEEGRLKGYRGINRDITERKKMEDEMRRKEEMMLAQSRQAAMGDMIAMIAHQWRQPITVVGMAMNNLRLDIELEEEITKERLENLADTVSRQVQHLAETIDDFRNFFKPNKEKETTTISHVMDSVMKIIGKSLENNNIEVVFQNRSESELLILSNELLQVFLNIFANAKDILKEKAEGARISIDIDESDEYVTTSICDNGGGIPQSAIDRIGEPYFTTKKTGTGLGLHMSKKIIEQSLGGMFAWENRGDGACFIVSVPKE